ncbi:MAG: metallophosphoesterase [Ignavibacteria bacterium]|jgi:UDP-2,3-diacylglucosamine pyrophosphatase LpxH
MKKTKTKPIGYFSYRWEIKVKLFFVFVVLLYATIDAQQNYDSLTVLYLTDIHICNYEGYCLDIRAKRREQYEDNYQAFEKFLERIPKQTRADEIVATGDNTDLYDAETIEGQLKAGQIEYFLTLYKKSPIPIYLTLGNHETLTIYTKATQKNKHVRNGHYKAEEARAVWIKNAKCFDKGIYYSRKLLVGGTPYLFLYLDVTYSLSDDPIGVFWNPEMLEWIENELDEKKDSKCVMFFHIPIPVADNNKDGLVIAKPKPGWPNEKTYRDGIMKILNDHSSIKALFVGHNHENVIEEIYLPGGHVITEIETGSFGEDENNWRIVKFKSNTIEISRSGSCIIEKTIDIK